MLLRPKPEKEAAANALGRKRLDKKYVMAILLLAIAVFVLVKVEYGIQQDREEEALLESLTTDGYLVYGADNSAPPLRYVDDDGVYKGTTVDFINLISVELGVEIKMVPYQWEDALEALRTGETDMCDMFASKEREKDFVFTDALYSLRTVMLVDADSEKELSDINSMRVATQKGDYANEYLQENYPQAELVYVKNVKEALELLIDGHVDGVIGDEPVATYYINKLDCSREVKMLETSLYERSVVLAVSKDKAELVPILNRAIEKIVAEGQMEKIQQKWFGLSNTLQIDNSKQKLRLTLYVIVLTLLAVIAVSYYLTRTLNREVKSRTQELEKKKNELQLIFDQIPAGIALVDANYKLINSNDNFFEIVGQEGLTNIYDLIKKCFVQQEEIAEKIETENEIYQVNCVPADDSVLVTMRNITLDEINSKQLLESSKMMAIGQLAAGMAHQIRNPLGIIRTQSFIMRTNVEVRDKIKKSLDYIDESVSRASGIIDNVMNFWRVSGETNSDITVKQFIESVVMLQAEEIKKKNVRVIIDCDDELTVYSNPEALKHIFHNLVSNSLDAMDGEGTLLLQVSKDKNCTVIRCSDTGCGIPEKNITHLFNPFFTTKEPGKGTGLGLFIVYSEIEKIGGNIEVSSKEGIGTSFTIKIPENRRQA